MHLTDWLVLLSHVANTKFTTAMSEARAAVSAALSLYKAEKLHVRQPFRSLTIATADPAGLAPFCELVTEEVDVKEVWALDAESAGYEARTDLILNPRAPSPEVHKLTSKLLVAVKVGQWELTEDGNVRFNNILLDGVPMVLETRNSVFALATRIKVGNGSLAATMLPLGAFVVLDTALDDALEAEGWVRGLVHLVQDGRKAVGLHVGGRIRPELRVPQDKGAWTGVHLDLVKWEVNCVDVSVVADSAVKELTTTAEKVARSAAGTDEARSRYGSEHLRNQQAV